MNIDQMTYNERLDPNNFDDEMEFRLANEDILREDLKDLWYNGFISEEQYIRYNEFCDYMEGK